MSTVEFLIQVYRRNSVRLISGPLPHWPTSSSRKLVEAEETDAADAVAAADGTERRFWERPSVSRHTCATSPSSIREFLQRFAARLSMR